MLDRWAETPRGVLALLVVLDQLSRNLYRGSADAFAADARARDMAQVAIARGFDLALHPVKCCFIYLPFEHSEDLADQDLAVRLFGTLTSTLGSEPLDHAELPPRDDSPVWSLSAPQRRLGRTNTPAEAAYLAQPGAWC